MQYTYLGEFVTVYDDEILEAMRSLAEDAGVSLNLPAQLVL